MARLMQGDRREQRHLFGVLGLLDAPVVLRLPRGERSSGDGRGDERQRRRAPEHEILAVSLGQLVSAENRPQHPRQRHGALARVALGRLHSLPVIPAARDADHARLEVDRAGRVVAQSADLCAGDRHHRVAPAGTGDPDA